MDLISYKVFKIDEGNNVIESNSVPELKNNIIIKQISDTNFELFVADDNGYIVKLTDKIIQDKADSDHKHEYGDLLNLPELFTEEKYTQDIDKRLKSLKIPFTELKLEDLNDIKNFGFYGKYNSSEATAARNYPSDASRGGHILVLPMTENDGTKTLFQVFFSAGTLNAGEYTNSVRMYIRSFVNNSQWLEWREIDGDKIHQLTSATQNLDNLHNNTFPIDSSTFIVNQAITITIPNKSLRVSYIKNTTDNITFTEGSGITIIGDKVIEAPIGTRINVDVQNGKAFINYNKQQTKIDNKIGLWV